MSPVPPCRVISGMQIFHHVCIVPPEVINTSQPAPGQSLKAVTSFSDMVQRAARDARPSGTCHVCLPPPSSHIFFCPALFASPTHLLNNRKLRRCSCRPIPAPAQWCAKPLAPFPRQFSLEMARMEVRCRSRLSRRHYFDHLGTPGEAPPPPRALVLRPSSTRPWLSESARVDARTLRARFALLPCFLC